MSVRAYRIKKIEYAEDSSFNLWHCSEDLTRLLEDNDFYSSINEGGGIGYITIDLLEEIITDPEKYGLDEFEVETIKEDIKEAKSNGDDYVEYYCF